MTSAVRSSPKTVIGVGTVSVLVIALVGLAVALRTIGDDEAPARRIEAPVAAPQVEWTRTAGIPDATVTKIVSSTAGTVAVGSIGGSGTIWYSPDRSTWVVAYPQPPTPSTSEAASGLFVEDVVVTTRGFLATGMLRSDETRGLVATVLISPDGRAWRAADQDAFLSASDAPTRGISSMIHGVVEDAGRFVAVGDVFTDNQHQRAGLSPGVWTSPDGTTWTRTRVDLGNGFDPYFSNLTARRGLFVAGGPADRYLPVAWISRDLSHWDPHTIARKGFARIAVTPHGYVAFGGIAVGTTRSPAYRPALWRSNDGRHWHRTLRLASGTNGTTFSFVGTAGETIIAVGQHLDDEGQTPTPFLYASNNGRTWTRIDPAGAVFPPNSVLSGSGTVGTSFVIAGTIPANDNAGISGSVLWTTND